MVLGSSLDGFEAWQLWFAAFALHVNIMPQHGGIIIEINTEIACGAG